MKKSPSSSRHSSVGHSRDSPDQSGLLASRHAVEDGSNPTEDAAECAGHQLQRTDQSDRDESDDQGVLDEPLSFFAVADTVERRLEANRDPLAELEHVLPSCLMRERLPHPVLPLSP